MTQTFSVSQTTGAASIPPALFDCDNLSAYVDFGRSRIYQLIKAGDFPKPIKFGKSSRWLRADIDAWIAQQVAAQQVAAPKVGG